MPKTEELVLEEEPGQPHTQALLDHYSELIRRQSGPRITPFRLPSVRRPMQVLGILGAIALYAITLTLLLQPEVNLGALPPAAVLALESDDDCAQRQVQILHAIDSYRRDHGDVPDRLESLIPQYLTAPVTDPASDRPYVYTRQGAAVILTCPNPDRHA